MRLEEMVSEVKHRAHIESNDEAVRVLSATIYTLGERIGRVEAKKMAQQLPNELGQIITRASNFGTYPLEEFYDHVAERTGVEYARAVEQANAVMQVLQEAVSQGEMEDVFTNLPTEYSQMLHHV
ncbi:MAG: DUF2267 domain-containing protein [Chitinivibrionales bacterium]